MVLFGFLAYKNNLQSLITEIAHLFFFFQPKFQCICDSGWQSSAGNPACVTDVNECELLNKPCSTNPVVPCFNTEGSFYCGACPAGNHWLGSTVLHFSADLSHQPFSPLGLELLFEVIFWNLPTLAGWQGNGYSCQDVNECLTNNGGCSTTPAVQCLNTMGSFHCGPCPPGGTWAK